MKVSELEGALLDYWVAKALGVTGTKVMRSAITGSKLTHKTEWYETDYPAYSADWAVGGPIIERNQIEIQYSMDIWMANIWPASQDGPNYLRSGPTPLAAAMRAFVACKFGDEVQIDSPAEGG